MRSRIPRDQLVTWMAGGALLFPGVVLAVLMAVIHPRPEGPHAFGSGYGVGVARSAETINGPDHPGMGRVSTTGLGDPVAGTDSDRAH